MTTTCNACGGRGERGIRDQRICDVCGGKGRVTTVFFPAEDTPSRFSRRFVFDADAEVAKHYREGA